ncbi:hypothetical protein PENSPDRAFT_624002 [Peniophora sp. CONT]|nr:hypothetical protein PENSPDRAFT_624002 [Peniophora sp. CONT]
MGHPCVVCAHPAKRRCRGCQKAHYCCSQHQKSAWPKHKQLCELYQAAAQASGSMPPRNTYCGLCGAQDRPLRKTRCCRQVLCYDPDAFCAEKGTCMYNHDRYTLCDGHYERACGGDWRTCTKCKEYMGHDLESYVYYGTNSFNFPGLTLADPPRFRPKKCNECRRKIVKYTEGWSSLGDTVTCAWCAGFYNEGQGEYYESGEEEDPEVVDADAVEPEPVVV